MVVHKQNHINSCVNNILKRARARSSNPGSFLISAQLTSDCMEWVNCGKLHKQNLKICITNFNSTFQIAWVFCFPFKSNRAHHPLQSSSKDCLKRSSVVKYEGHKEHV